MRLSMEKDNGRDEILIKIYAEPIKILSIEGGIVWCEWENRRWKMFLPGWYTSIFSKEFDEIMQKAFLSRVNKALESIGDDKEPE